MADLLSALADEGGTAVTSVQDRVYAPNVDRVVNAWHTFGPIGGPSSLFNFTQEFRLWYEASVGVPSAGYAGTPLSSSNSVTLFSNQVRHGSVNSRT